MFNETLAVRDIWLVQATCCDLPSIGNWSCGLACSKVSLLQPRVIERKDLQLVAIIGKDPEQEENCMLGFRGSSTTLNWFEDFDFFPMDYGPDCPGCKVHNGFLHGWRSILSP